MFNRFHRQLLLSSCVFVIIAQGCGGGGSDNPSVESTVPDGLSDYIGTWVASCTSAAPTFIYTLSISPDGQYWVVEREYDAEANCGDDNSLENVKITTALVSDIAANSDNNQYKDLYLNVSRTRKTPYSTKQVSEWISAEHCGRTDWSQGSEMTFDSNNSGNGCHQNTVRPAVLLDATTLSMNGRGGFDGLDPVDIVYTRQSSNPRLTGKIAGKPWMAISGTAEELFTPGELFFVIHETYIPDVCNSFASSVNHILFSFPATTGSYTLSLSGDTVTLYDGDTNYIALDGSVDISTVTTDLVTGSMTATR